MELPENYILEQRDVKHARIRVSENLSVRIIVPMGFSSSDVANLISKKQIWIDKNLNRFQKEPEKIKLHHNQILLFGNKYNYLYRSELHNKVLINQEHKTIQSKMNLLESEIQIKWYKRYARRFILDRLAHINDSHQFKYQKVFIRDQRTKWGNCSKDKNLSFNWKLIKAPMFVIDYIIIHELLHTRIMNHTQKFWTELRQLYPDYHEAILWLDKYGKRL
jgi:predicted metal-dependent hydrolase